MCALICVMALKSASGQEFTASSVPVHALNSPYAEEFLAVHPEGNMIAFSRANHPYNQGGPGDQGDVWLAHFDSSWHVPRNWHQINSEELSSPVGWSSDGSTFLYNRVKVTGGSLETEIWAVGNNGTPGRLDIAYFKNKSTLQSGCLSADNRYLIVSMESGATQGVEDLYIIKRNGNSWSAPNNLGPTINTKFQEITPFLAPDNRTLYFASNGRKGEGSFDIYSSERLDDTWRHWSEPVNLGPLVNTSGRESSFVFSPQSDKAFFVSTRNSDGYGDVRVISFKNDSIATVLAVDTLSIVDEHNTVARKGLQLINAKSSAPILDVARLTSGASSRSHKPDAQGWIAMETAFTGEVSVVGFMPMGVTAYPGSSVVLRLEPLEMGRTIRLDNVLFARGKAVILKSSFEELDRVVEMMKSNPEIKIRLKGHTDGNGDKSQNLKLSEERALSAKKYLMSKGVSRKRIESQGYGGEEPIASNATEETRRLNRRVEIEIME